MLLECAVAALVEPEDVLAVAVAVAVLVAAGALEATPEQAVWVAADLGKITEAAVLAVAVVAVSLALVAVEWDSLVKGPVVSVDLAEPIMVVGVDPEAKMLLAVQHFVLAARMAAAGLLARVVPKVGLAVLAQYASSGLERRANSHQPTPAIFDRKQT